MRRRRGFLLIMTLLLCVIMFIFGVSMMSQRVSQYRAALDIGLASKAQAIARAGIEDALIKLAKDPDFPPAGSEDQRIFTYSEVLRDKSNTVIGSYTVTLDRTYAELPYALLLVTSTGISGPAPSAAASRTITAELDVSPTMRDDPNVVNPNYFHWTNWIDGGSY